MPLNNVRQGENVKKTFYFISAVLLIFVAACISNCKTISDVLELKKFNEESALFIQVSDGKVIKNTNQYVQGLFGAMKKSDLVTDISSSPSLHIELLKGSSFPSQVIRLHVSESGEKYIEYKDKKIVYFKSISLYEVALDSFNKSNIILD